MHRLYHFIDASTGSLKLAAIMKAAHEGARDEMARRAERARREIVSPLSYSESLRDSLLKIHHIARTERTILRNTPAPALVLKLAA